MAFVTTILCSLTAGSAFAQMRWQGEVSSPVMLRIRGDRVDFDTRYAGNARVQFQAPLPAGRARVSVNVVEGRGDARVVDQPTRANNYTATLSLNPRRGREFMAIEVTWDNAGFDRGRYDNGALYRGRDASGGGSVTWTGQVDHEAIIEFRGGRAQVRTVQGQPVYGANANFSAPLPRADANVQLADVRGRGQVQVIQQPNAANGYTARVRVYDEDNGAGPYAFTLTWSGGYGGAPYANETYRRGPFDRDGNDRNRYDAGRQYSGGNRMLWTGRVDGRVRVIVQGNRSWVETLSGRPPAGVRAEFGSPLPAANINIRVDRQHGRDDVRLVERPSPANGYRAVFEIDDNDSGDDEYQVELNW